MSLVTQSTLFYNNWNSVSFCHPKVCELTCPIPRLLLVSMIPPTEIVCRSEIDKLWKHTWSFSSLLSDFQEFAKQLQTSEQEALDYVKKLINERIVEANPLSDSIEGKFRSLGLLHAVHKNLVENCQKAINELMKCLSKPEHLDKQRSIELSEVIIALGEYREQLCESSEENKKIDELSWELLDKAYRTQVASIKIDYIFHYNNWKKDQRFILNTTLVTLLYSIINEFFIKTQPNWVELIFTPAITAFLASLYNLFKNLPNI